MFADLPESIKKQVELHLLSNNFKLAKAIHDAWVDRQRSDRFSSSQPNCA